MFIREANGIRRLSLDMLYMTLLDLLCIPCELMTL